MTVTRRRTVHFWTRPGDSHSALAVGITPRGHAAARSLGQLPPGRTGAVCSGGPGDGRLRWRTHADEQGQASLIGRRSAKDAVVLEGEQEAASSSNRGGSNSPCPITRRRGPTSTTRTGAQRAGRGRCRPIQGRRDGGAAQTPAGTHAGQIVRRCSNKRRHILRSGQSEFVRVSRWSVR